MLVRLWLRPLRVNSAHWGYFCILTALALRNICVTVSALTLVVGLLWSSTGMKWLIWVIRCCWASQQLGRNGLWSKHSIHWTEVSWGKLETRLNSNSQSMFVEELQLTVTPCLSLTHFGSSYFSVWQQRQVSASTFSQHCTAFWVASCSKSDYILTCKKPYCGSLGTRLFRRTTVYLFGPFQSSNACSHLFRYTKLME